MVRLGSPRVLLLIVCVLALTACNGDATGGSASGTSSTGPEEATEDEVPVTTTQETTMLVALLEAMCGETCSGNAGTLYVFDPTGRLIDDARTAMASLFGPVAFVDSQNDLIQLYSELPEGEAVVSFSELRRIREDVVQIDTWVATGPESALSRSWLFSWSGSTWSLADPADVGVTVTTSVS